MRGAFLGVGLALVAGVAGACGGVGAAEDASTGDGGGATTGLLVTWSARPSLPAMPRGDLRVTHVVARVDSLRAIGDAGPSDARTTASHLALDWTAAASPAPVALPAAPPGLYSEVSLRLEGEGLDAYVVEGEVELDHAWRPFRIHDMIEAAVQVRVGVRLEAGAQARIPLALDAGRLVEELDFGALREVDGTLELGPGDPQIGAVRDGLDAALRLDGSAPR